MAMPKKRMSSVRSGNRRRQIGLVLPATQTCPNCKSQMIKHRACQVCGHYRGRLVVNVALPAARKGAK